jgi:hypothetical protein
MNVSLEFSQQFLEGYRSGLTQAVAESATHANAVAPWYKAILAHPFLASALVMLLLMAVGYLFMVYLCKQPKFALPPFLAMWGIFGLIASMTVHPLTPVLLWSAGYFFLSRLESSDTLSSTKPPTTEHHKA